MSYVYRRASFDPSVPGAKRRCLTDGEDPEEDVEEQRVSEIGPISCNSDFCLD